MHKFECPGKRFLNNDSVINYILNMCPWCFHHTVSITNLVLLTLTLLNSLRFNLFRTPKSVVWEVETD